MEVYQIKKLLHIKEHNNQNEKENLQNGIKIFASYSSNNRLISRIYRVQKINTKEQIIQSINGQMN
jgi:hypothetical protein